MALPKQPVTEPQSRSRVYIEDKTHRDYKSTKIIAGQIDDPDNFNISESDVQKIVQPTELGEALKHINDDSLDPDTNMSNMDMHARLHPLEISSILAVDTLCAYKYLHKEVLPLTRQKKRLSVSIKGKGRSEEVEIVVGKREMDMKKGGVFQNIKGFFSGDHD